jgi:hypothetical protein
MLQAELGELRAVRVSGLRPGPMRTALRGKAYRGMPGGGSRPADYARPASTCCRRRFGCARPDLDAA